MVTAEDISAQMLFNPDLIVSDLESMPVVNIEPGDIKGNSRKYTNKVIAEAIEKWVECDGNAAVAARALNRPIGNVSNWVSKYYLNIKTSNDRIILVLKSKI